MRRVSAKIRQLFFRFMYNFAFVLVFVSHARKIDLRWSRLALALAQHTEECNSWFLYTRKNAVGSPHFGPLSSIATNTTNPATQAKVQRPIENGIRTFTQLVCLLQPAWLAVSHKSEIRITPSGQIRFGFVLICCA